MKNKLIGILFELEELPNHTRITLVDWDKLGSRWRGELNRKITQLIELRDMMTDCIGCGCLSLDRRVFRIDRAAHLVLTHFIPRYQFNPQRWNQ
ncbi:hypothetical protein AAG587_02405 [Vreelandella neptunia]|uniref:hypothetical protein n=1 Tax=Vreelandella neptunia TaxID=115551 RepID=UPI00105DC6E4